MHNKTLMILTPKTFNGGAEHVAARLSRHFHEHYDVCVVSFDSSRIDYDYAGTLLDLALMRGDGLVKRFTNLCKSVRKIRGFKRSTKPVACISLIGYPNLANALTRQDEICILSVRTFMRRSPNVIKHYLQKKLVKWVYNRADRVVAICEGVKKDLVEYYGVDPSKVDVIYPYFDVAEIQRKSREMIEPEWQEVFAKRVIVTAGRLTYDKGQWHLIKAFSIVKKVLPDAVLVILGRGDMEDELKDLAERCGHADDIHFMGYCSNPFKYMRSAKVFAFPSLIEGFGNALGEALACGTPAVAADCNVGPREILAPHSDVHATAREVEEHLAGFLTPAFDERCDLAILEPDRSERDMADALLRVLEDDATREKMAISAETRAWDFDISVVTAQWDSLLQPKS